MSPHRIPLGGLTQVLRKKTIKFVPLEVPHLPSRKLVIGMSLREALAKRNTRLFEMPKDHEGHNFFLEVKDSENKIHHGHVTGLNKKSGEVTISTGSGFRSVTLPLTEIRAVSIRREVK